MKPSEAAIKAAEEAFLLSACSFPDKLDAALRAAYDAQFEDEMLYRIDYTQDKSDGAWVLAHTESLVSLGVLVPVEGDER